MLIVCSQGWISDNVGIAISIVNNTILLVYPAAVVFIFHPNPSKSMYNENFTVIHVSLCTTKTSP